MGGLDGQAAKINKAEKMSFIEDIRKREKHRRRMRRYMREWYQKKKKDPEWMKRRAEYMREYRRKNRERLNKYYREYLAKKGRQEKDPLKRTITLIKCPCGRLFKSSMKRPRFYNCPYCNRFIPGRNAEIVKMTREEWLAVRKNYYPDEEKMAESSKAGYPEAAP